MSKFVKPTIYKIRLKKGDNVIVLAGKYKGKTSVITAVHPKDNKVTVENINVVKKHQKPTKKYPQGGIIELTKPIWVSKVAIIEPTSKKASRIAYKLGKDNKKVRVYTRTKQEIK